MEIEVHRGERDDKRRNVEAGQRLGLEEHLLAAILGFALHVVERREKESARAALSFIRSRANAYGIDGEFYKNKDIHIHFPEGAVPKDGPSAGITVTTALVSALTGRKVRADAAMTGEITLRGRVLPIGGLKEKSMAAYIRGIDTVIIPKANVPDLDEVDDAVKAAVRFVPVSHVDEVLDIALLPVERIKDEPEIEAKQEKRADIPAGSKGGDRRSRVTQ